MQAHNIYIQVPAGQIDVHAESPTRTMHTRMNGGYALLLAIL